MEEYAARLGADCAFFIKNKPVFASGIGNIFEPIELSLKGYYLVLVKPNIFVSTRDAFACIKPQHPEVSLKEIIKRPISKHGKTGRRMILSCILEISEIVLSKINCTIWDSLCFNERIRIGCLWYLQEEDDRKT